ncbi:MAG: hypothetical protein AAF368_06355, partial [Planctomycetota bacterium]
QQAAGGDDRFAEDFTQALRAQGRAGKASDQLSERTGKAIAYGLHALAKLSPRRGLGGEDV